MEKWLAVAAICLPWLGGLCVWSVGDDRPRLQHRLASSFAILGGLLSLALLPITSDKIILRIPVGSVFGDFTLIADGLGVSLAVIAAVIGGLAVIYSNDYMQGEAQLGRYYSLTLLFIGAMIGLVLSGSLLFMFIFWEITAFCSYALISFHNDDPKAVAGGVKALIITQFGGLGLLAAALISYTFFGSYQINIFLSEAASLPAFVLSLCAFGCLAAAAAKSAQVPFQTWLPDAMEAPTPISALIHAATMVNAGVYLLARFYPAFEAVAGWKTAVILVGMFSALLAALMAVVSHDLKRVLAYSTISQLGYMVYAIGCGAIIASQFHLLSHSIFKALLFLCAGALIQAIGTRDMFQMNGLGSKMPFVRAAFIIGALALVGLPVTNGFFSKEMVLEGGLVLGPLWAYLGMLVGVGITALYSMRMVSLVFYEQLLIDKDVKEAPRIMRFVLAVLAFGTLTTWLLIGTFSQRLAGSLPFHNLHSEDLTVVVIEIVTSPWTYLALTVVCLGLLTRILRFRYVRIWAGLAPAAEFARQGFGFEWINQQIIRIINNTAESLRKFQTGQLNWNVVGIVAGLVVILAVIAWVG